MVIFELIHDSDTYTCGEYPEWGWVMHVIPEDL